MKTWQFVIGNEASTTPGVLQGFKLTASNAVDVLLINLQSFGTARLAPYLGWEHLIDLSKRNFEGLVKVVGVRQATRVASRYINRIDIPLKILKDDNPASFLNIGIRLPTDITDTNAGPFSLATNFIEKNSGAKFWRKSALLSLF